MSLFDKFLLSSLLLFTLIFARISGLIMTAPIFSAPAVPVRIRLSLAFCLALLITPMYVQQPLVHVETILSYLVLVGGEIAIGIILALGMLLLFSGIQVAGQMISQLSGMSLADVIQPGFNERIPIVSQLLYYIAVSIFLVVGGHRLVIGGLLDTFHAIPPGYDGISTSILETLVTALTQSFSFGIRAAAPVMVSLLLATLALGFISRTLPQINTIALGFSLSSLVALGGLFLALGAIFCAFQEEIRPMLELFPSALENYAD